MASLLAHERDAALLMRAAGVDPRIGLAVCLQSSRLVRTGIMAIEFFTFLRSERLALPKERCEDDFENFLKHLFDIALYDPVLA